MPRVETRADRRQQADLRAMADGKGRWCGPQVPSTLDPPRTIASEDGKESSRASSTTDHHSVDTPASRSSAGNQEDIYSTRVVSTRSKTTWDTTSPASSSIQADGQKESSTLLTPPKEAGVGDDAVATGSKTSKRRRKSRYAVEHSPQWIINEVDEPQPAQAHHVRETSPVGMVTQRMMLSRRSGEAFSISPGHDAPALSPIVAPGYSPRRGA